MMSASMKSSQHAAYAGAASAKQIELGESSPADDIAVVLPRETSAHPVTSLY
jgi:hypothetical protein